MGTDGTSNGEGRGVPGPDDTPDPPDDDGSEDAPASADGTPGADAPESADGPADGAAGEDASDSDASGFDLEVVPVESITDPPAEREPEDDTTLGDDGVDEHDVDAASGDSQGWRRWAELGDDDGTDDPSRARVAEYGAVRQAGSRRERVFATVLSFVLPGVGHIVAGRNKRGAAMLTGSLIWLAFHWFVMVPFFAVVLGAMTVFLAGVGALLAPVFGAATQFVIHVLAGVDAHREISHGR